MPLMNWARLLENEMAVTGDVGLEFVSLNVKVVVSPGATVAGTKSVVRTVPPT